MSAFELPTLLATAVAPSVTVATIRIGILATLLLSCPAPVRIDPPLVNVEEPVMAPVGLIDACSTPAFRMDRSLAPAVTRDTELSRMTPRDVAPSVEFPRTVTAPPLGDRVA